MRVLLVTQDTALQQRVQLGLDRHEMVVVAAVGVSDAARKMAAEDYPALLVDARGEGAGPLVAALAGAGPPVVALVDPAAPQGAEEALEAGALDVVAADAIDAILALRLRRVARAGALPVRAQRGAHARTPRPGLRKSDVLVGHSEPMRALLQQVEMLARSDIGVLITGETGTGKELVARTLHAAGARAGGPFVVANCTALPETLFENELFGHERGAYTGANRRQGGLIDEAHGGTLLLDEIGEITDAIQAKLLRLLQFREYKLVGGTRTLTADVRLLATTHRDLAELVRRGRFREDLYYRLHTLEIRLPPLRSRLEDLPVLVDHFVGLYNDDHGGDFVGLTPNAVARLSKHDWPGNVRELENVVNRSLVMATRRLLDAADVAMTGVTPAAAVDLERPFAELRSDVVDRFERAYLDQLLRRTKGNLSLAARLSQHQRKSLWRLCQRHGLEPDRYREGADESG
jgi:DNA-binding NtrC family response regulator